MRAATSLLGSCADADGEGSGDALDGAADGFFEWDRGLPGECEDGFGGVGFGSGFAVGPGVRGHVELVFDQVGDDLGVGLGDELVAFDDEGAFEGEVVFDDAVVDDDESAAAVAVGMGVFFGGAAVGGPAGMADAEGAVEGRIGDGDFEIAELSWGAAQGKTFGTTGYGDAGGVVAAVFEAAEAFNNDGDDRLRSDVTNDSTHRLSLVGMEEFCMGERV